MSENWIIGKCKKAKVLYDTVKMVKVIVRLVVGLLSLGGGSYLLMNDTEAPEPEKAPKKAIVEELTITHINPDYERHSHPELLEEIERVIKDHDPLQLGH